jgi:hypothetical protein
VATAILATGLNFRRTLGYCDLRMIKAKLENEMAIDSKQMTAYALLNFNHHPLSTEFWAKPKQGMV